MKKIDLLKRKLPYDTLGRSLASNAFYPKDLYTLLKRKKIKDFYPLKEEFFFSKIDKDIGIYSKDLEELAYFKRYNNNFLLYSDFIKDEHQLLLALVYGADAVLLKDKLLLEKACHFGLSVLFFTKNIEDLRPGLVLFTKDEMILKELEANDCLALSTKAHDRALKIKDIL